MDRTLKGPVTRSTIAVDSDALRSLARELVTWSREFEPFIPGQTKGMHENLALLGSLEAVTRESVEKIQREKLRDAHIAAQLAAQAAAVSSAAADSAARAVKAAGAAQPAPKTNSSSTRAAPSRPAPPRPAFGSRTAQYRPALKDPSLVEALLRLRAASASAAAASSPGTSARATASGGSVAGAKPLGAGFSEAAPARIDTSEKYSTVPRRAGSPGVGVPILRPTR